MAKTVRNWSEFQKAVEGRIQLALTQTRDVVAKCLQESLNEYYKEKVFRGGTSNQPAVYDRTYALLNSMVKTDVVRNGNMFHCEVKIDENYLQYNYEDNGDTGYDVLMMNELGGWHGVAEDYRVKGDHHIWTEAVNNIVAEGGVLTIFKDKLRRCGINVR